MHGILCSIKNVACLVGGCHSSVECDVEVLHLHQNPKVGDAALLNHFFMEAALSVCKVKPLE